MTEKCTKNLDRKVDSAVRGEIMAQRNGVKLRLRTRREIGKREIPILLLRRSIKNLNLSDFNYTKQVDGHIRLRETG